MCAYYVRGSLLQEATGKSTPFSPESSAFRFLNFVVLEKVNLHKKCIGPMKFVDVGPGGSKTRMLSPQGLKTGILKQNVNIAPKYVLWKPKLV